MLYCKAHRRGDLLGSGGSCPQCKRYTSGQYKLCTGCAVRANRCAICLDEVTDLTLGKRFKASVFAAEKRQDLAVSRAKKVLETAIAPFATEAQAFDTAMKAAIDTYNVAIKPYQDADKAAQENAQQAGHQGGDVIAAADACKKARAEMWEHARALGEVMRASQAAAKEAFATHFDTYVAAKAAYDKSERIAFILMDLRFEQLFGHVNVDLNYLRRLADYTR